MMKPETRRLLILNLVMIGICVLLFFLGVAKSMDLAVSLAQLELFAYGVYLLVRHAQAKRTRAN